MRSSALRRLAVSVALAVAFSFGAGAARSDEAPGGRVTPPATLLSSTPQTVAAAPALRRLRPEIIATYPHDPTAFTQGLLLHGGFLYESTGNYGQSTLRRVEPESGKVAAQVALPANLFGEGLALAGDKLIQLTWREGVALVYDLSRFEKVGQVSYTGEGWGLCFDGQWLVMSDGSDRLTFRDPATLAVWRRLPVRMEGRPVMRLNELECVGDSVYANVWGDTYIVEVDKGSGNVRSRIEASGLLSPEERAHVGPEAVLNGIAYDAASDTFLLTGKDWPKLFRVKLVAEH
jgi:glutaminyl-peptide cyclotransferase